MRRKTRTEADGRPTSRADADAPRPRADADDHDELLGRRAASAVDEHLDDAFAGVIDDRRRARTTRTRRSSTWARCRAPRSTRTS